MIFANGLGFMVFNRRCCGKATVQVVCQLSAVCQLSVVNPLEKKVGFFLMSSLPC